MRVHIDTQALTSKNIVKTGEKLYGSTQRPTKAFHLKSNIILKTVRPTFPKEPHLK